MKEFNVLPSSFKNIKTLKSYSCHLCIFEDLKLEQRKTSEIKNYKI